jgi:8-oxo-dGDP phosphatase
MGGAGAAGADDGAADQDLADHVFADHVFAVRSSHDQFIGRVFSVVSDEVAMPGGGVAVRDYVRHVGAVGVVAVDDVGRVVLVRQYRHPVRRQMWELPAGLIDVVGEDLPAAARRELAEEADLVAERIDLLVDLHTSPGCSNEMIRIFLARDLAPVSDQDRYDRRDEEAQMQVRLVDVDEAVRMVLAGEITNAAAVAGLLAAARARDLGWTSLRSVTEPVPR